MTSRFLVCVSVCGGFDWLCFVASALFAVGYVGFQNWLVFFSAKVMVNGVCEIASASLALSVFRQSQFLQNLRSGRLWF